MQEQSFETAINRLEEIVNTLETGKLSLEESLALFQQGCDTITECDRKLKQAQLVVEELQASLAEKDENDE